jgi:hypothetical protein
MAHHCVTGQQCAAGRPLSMSIETLLLGYVVATLAGIGAVAIYSELRTRRFEPMPSEDNIFRCEGCGFVYTDDADVDLSRCPQCGRMNEAIEF